MKQDVYKKVTDTILTALEAGTRPWMQPWHAAHAAGPISRPLRHNGKPYSGINTLMLWGTAMEKGYSAPIWMTYKQAQELGAQVKKGEHGSLVVYANSITRTETDEKTGEDVDIEIPYMKGYTVFNVEQIGGLPAHYYARTESPHLSDAQRHARLDAFFAATHAAYIGDWLRVLEDDKTAIFTAASHAQKAADFLLNLQPAPTPNPEPDAGGDDLPTTTVPDSTPEPEPACESESGPATGEESPASGPPVLTSGKPEQLSFF